MVRLKDIAVKTGFSVNTVSLALNREGRVSKETRDIIRKCAEEMGYIPNALAQKMRTGKSRLLALIIDNMIDSYFSFVADDIIKYASFNNYDILLYTTQGDKKAEQKAILSAIGRNVDGVLVFPLDGFKGNTLLMENNGVPYVLIGRAMNEFEHEQSIAFDDIRVGYISAEYLALNGHRSIAAISSDSDGFNGELRRTGIKMAFATYGISMNDNSFYCVPYNRAARKAALDRIISEAQGCTAMICSDDLLAYELIECLRKCGKKVPEDVSVIGFGNVQHRANALQDITTVQAEEGLMAAVSIEMIMDQIEGKKTDKATVPVFLKEGSTVLSR